ncbi:hypothetical protein [Amycolatopsis sp.]|uniref:hypothetical protein n=1 Tax=Amycolatopsis sp. TaxID=37632 RepID=UPI002D7EC4D0|nr:hypothetical protein [Amycolatopsis sp.]HET6711328.1 hypothetical protein [Amycolatopsis sp.]
MTTTEPATGKRSGPDLPGQPAQASAAAETSVFDAFKDVAEREGERRRLHLLNDVESDPVFVDYRDPKEQKADRKVATKIRKAERKRREKAAIDKIKAEAKLAKSHAAIDKEDAKEQIMLRRAVRKRRKLTNTGSHLAATYVRHRLVASILGAVALAGLVWTSHGIAAALASLAGQATPAPYLYLVEPLFSTPLLAIVIMQVFAAEKGRLAKVSPIKTVLRKGKTKRRISMIGYIEAFSLVSTVVFNTLPAFKAEQFALLDFMSRFFPPLLIVMATSLLYVAADLFGGVIRDAVLEGDDDETKIRTRIKKANIIARQVQAAMDDPEAPMKLEADGLPSVAEIARRYPAEKLVAQAAHDILALPQITGLNSTEGR